MSGPLTPAAARIGHIAEKREVYFKHYRASPSSLACRFEPERNFFGGLAHAVKVVNKCPVRL